MRERHDFHGDHSEFFRVVHSFKKLNISIMLPDLTHAELGTLSMIAHCKEDNHGSGVKVSDVVTCMEVPAPAVSRTLKKMEKRGFIIRTVDKDDRRNTYIEMTPKGESILKESKKIMHDFADAVLGELGEEKMNRLIAYLKNLQAVALEEIEKRKYNSRKDEAEHEKDI